MITESSGAPGLPPITEVTDLAWRLAHDANKRPPGHVGLSQIGECVARLGHTLAGTEPTDPGAAAHAQHRIHKDALIGTFTHAGYLKFLNQAWLKHRADHAHDEREVTLPIAGHDITGHIDSIAHHMLNGHEVLDILDLKTVSEYRYKERSQCHTATLRHWMQTGTYALAAEHTHGSPVARVTIQYVNRNRHADDLTYTLAFRGEPVPGYTWDLATMTRARLDDIDRAAENPDAARKEYLYCGDCPFQRRCLGKAVQEESGDAIIKDEAVAALLDKYAQTRAEQGILKKRIDDMKELLHNLSPDDGIYPTDDGNTYSLKWNEGGTTTDTKTLVEFIHANADQPDIKSFLDRHRGKIPTKPRSGSWAITQEKE